MILSNVEIHKALDEGRLIISPEPSPRTRQVGAMCCPYDTCSVDLTLHENIVVPMSGTFAYDLVAEGKLSELLARTSEHFRITREQPFSLEPNRFILARTIEEVEFPIGEPPFLAGRIEGKSSRARCGLLVHFTAPTVHSGFKGSLTLEIINLGPATFVLRPGMPIAQLIIEEVKGRPIDNPSDFHGQVRPEGA